MADKATLKLAAKNQQTINRLAKLVPGNGRRWEFENIIEKVAADVDNIYIEDNPGLEAEVRADGEKDILFLRRLAWDLHAARLAISGPPRGRSSECDSQGPRP